MESGAGSEHLSSATMPSPPTATPRRSSASHGSSLLSKLSFMRTSSSTESRSTRTIDENNATSDNRNLEGFATALQEQQQQQQRTRRRRGSLRKVALLGRGAQRERREYQKTESESAPALVPPRINTDALASGNGQLSTSTSTSPMSEHDGYGLGISDITPRPSMDGYASRAATAQLAAANEGSPPKQTANAFSRPTVQTDRASFPDLVEPDSQVTSPTVSYSTTDDEDALHMGGAAAAASAAAAALLRPERASVSSSSDGYFPVSNVTPLASSGIQSLQRRRSIQRAKSPLALTGLTGLPPTPLPVQDTDWDYSETEWWGWVVLVVTWLVFVTGMGSCLGIWSWAWDVGTTPYAPPELEDDPTLPIVGYYPALIILSCVMAWVWVVAAWVGMKYFRHARVSGD